jgi:hypothetical protein
MATTRDKAKGSKEMTTKDFLIGAILSITFTTFIVGCISPWIWFLISGTWPVWQQFVLGGLSGFSVALSLQIGYWMGMNSNVEG